VAILKSPGGLVRVVVKITGKVFDGEVGADTILRIAELLKQKLGQGYRFAVVVGGGRRAREYIELGRRLGIGEAFLDALGIEVSRVNALLMASLLAPHAYLPIPRSVDDFLEAWASGKVVVLGGLQPGQSTNAVAAIVSELIGADLLINATDVLGVYDSNPKLNPNAKLLKEVTVEELERLALRNVVAGSYELFDMVALEIVKRSKIPLVFLSVYDVENMTRLLEGKDFTGTRIVY